MITRANANPVNGQTLSEEIFNAVSHGLGVALSVAGLVLLVVYSAIQDNVWKIVSFSLFGASMILLYLSSTLYHAVQSVRLKNFFRIFDHSSIYVLIAGTYTPYLLLNLRGTLGWTLFGIIWGCALIGISLKARHLGKYDTLSAILYLCMGWMIVLAMKQMMASIPFQGFVWMMIGGVVYSLGIIFYLIDTRMPFAHSIWHLFVLGGSTAFFFSMFFYVL